MDVTAIFPDVDAAEHALVNLQSLGVQPIGYKIRRVRALPGRDDADMSDHNPPAGFSNSLTGAVIGGPLALNVFAMPAAGKRSPTLTPDGASREVELIVTVEDKSGIRAHRALVSNHGRKVRYQ